MQLDVEDPAAIYAFTGDVQEQFPKLNVLINNAGIQKSQNFIASDSNILDGRSVIQNPLRALIGYHRISRKSDIRHCEARRVAEG